MLLSVELKNDVALVASFLYVEKFISFNLRQHFNRFNFYFHIQIVVLGLNDFK
jgi:hypothetical protein